MRYTFSFPHFAEVQVLIKLKLMTNYYPKMNKEMKLSSISFRKKYYQFSFLHSIKSKLFFLLVAQKLEQFV